MDHKTEQDAGLLEQGATMLEEHAEEQRTRGNCSAAEGAACSAHAIRRLAPALLRAGRGCLAQIEEPAGAAPAAVAGPACDLTELAMLNKLIELGTQAYGALAESNSDDGPAGTAAYVRWQERRAEMGELIRSRAAPALEAPAHQCCNSWFLSLPEGRQAVLRENQWMLADAAYQAGRESRSALEAPAAPAGDLALIIAALEHGQPQMAHYAEPCERHAQALAAARRMAAAPQAPAAPAVDAPEADMFWNADDPDSSYDSLNDAVVGVFEGGGVRPGGFVEIQRAASMSNIMVRITSDRPFAFELVEEPKPDENQTELFAAQAAAKGEHDAAN